MALAAELLELTKHMAPDDAKVFENLLTKNTAFEKELREGVLRQSDYDKKMNASKTELQTAKSTAAEWKKWADDNMPIYRETIDAYAELEKQQKELQEKLTAAEAARTAAGGDTVDPAELTRRVQEEVAKLGYASKADMDRVINEQTGKLAREEANKFVQEAQTKFYAESVPGVIGFSMDAAEIAYEYRQEFGSQIDRAKFSDFMKERNIVEPKKAYEEYVRPQRDKSALDKAIADAVKAKEAEIQQQYSAAGLPGGGMVPPGLQPRGAMQMKIERDNAERAGSMATSIAASEAAKELRNEGKF